MQTIKNVPDKIFAKIFVIPEHKLESIKSYKQTNASGKEIITAKRDENTKLWEITYHD